MKRHETREAEALGKWRAAGGQRENPLPFPFLPTDEAEENLVCALWQHWREAISFTAVSGCVLFFQKAFTRTECRLVVQALWDNDGDPVKAENALCRLGAWQLHSLQRIVFLCKHFPQSPRSAVKIADTLLRAMRAKGGAS